MEAKETAGARYELTGGSLMLGESRKTVVLGIKLKHEQDEIRSDLNLSQ